VKTARYKAWIATAEYELFKQWPVVGQPGVILAPISVTYRLVRPDKRKRDLGNLEKGLSDILVSTGIIGDDSQIEDLRLLWVESVDAVQIDIMEIEP
jgi:crossover junction endodeoxyribonuclease RusA